MAFVFVIIEKVEKEIMWKNMFIFINGVEFWKFSDENQFSNFKFFLIST